MVLRERDRRMISTQHHYLYTITLIVKLRIDFK
jgi:hypothetical protein